MLRLGFSESRQNSNLVRCVLRPPYSNAMFCCARQRLDYFESTFSEKFAFSGRERVNINNININATVIYKKKRVAVTC